MPPTKTPHRARWKPALWLIALDAVGLSLLALGLVMQFAPGSALGQALPPSLRLPLLILGGSLFAICWMVLAMSIIGHRRS